MITLYRTNKSVIGEFQVDSVKEAVEFAVKQGANLVGANLAFKDLAGANLAGAYAKFADLEGANCKGAIFEGANLTNANLTNANLTNANLTRANFEGANLKDADLKGAIFEGANLDYAAISIQCTSTDAMIDDRFAAQLAYLLTRQDYSNCSEEVKKEIEQIKSMSLANLLAKYRNDID